MNPKEIASMVRDAVEERLDDIRHSASRYGKTGRAKVAEVRDDVAEFVEDRPFQSLLIAVGVGVLVGLCWRLR